MKLVLHNYWRSSASHRVRIALGLKELAYEYVVVNILQARAARRRLPREEPDGAGADARDHRGRRHGPRAHAVAADPRVPRRAVPGARRCCRRIRTCARARARSPRSSTRGIQPLQNLSTTKRIKAARRRRRRVGEGLHRDGLAAFERAARRDRRARSASATRRRSPTAASCRSSRRARRFGVDVARYAAARSRSRSAASRCPRSRTRAPDQPTRRGESEVMAKLESLGIKRLEGIHYYVHDLERVAAASTPTSSTSPRPGAARPSSSSRAASVGVLLGRQHQVVCSAAGRRGRPRGALPARSTPTASAR